ncbi:MAG: hypothetical protein FD187_976 [bacterium]|nr:MAG: hypothetical protein FD142_107 [bacterium]KAF0149682.1 MAG: hypothetical protein FD187_976 [bacterium]KAF0169348.1 MAG: hypothetical protein FD158_538 [bacterium]TXT21378.1 MAG: hypothetical protein FD132_667 [bacterium]
MLGLPNYQILTNWTKRYGVKKLLARTLPLNS